MIMPAEGAILAETTVPIRLLKRIGIVFLIKYMDDMAMPAADQPLTLPTTINPPSLVPDTV